jgi:hypothetical protein
MFMGNRVLLPRVVADSMWHLEQGRRRIRAGEIIVRFDNLDADIALDARSDLAARAIADGTYEPEPLPAIPKLLGDGDAINVGANVGVVAIVMRKAMSPGGRLLCVEPIEECVARLSSTLARVGPIMARSCIGLSPPARSMTPKRCGPCRDGRSTRAADGSSIPGSWRPSTSRPLCRPFASTPSSRRKGSARRAS